MVSETDRQLWQQYAEAWANHQHKRYLLDKNLEDLPALIRDVLSTYPAYIGALLPLLENLSLEQLIELFPLLLSYATSGSGRTYPREFAKFILGIPKEWLKDNIENYAEPLLSHNDIDTDQVFAHMLSLYYRIDMDLTLKLIDRAIAHPNPDVQEHGKAWLEEIKNESESGTKNE